MKKSILSLALVALAPATSLFAQDYNFPEDIQQSNILHCFDWKFKDVEAELPRIAEAGFGAVQVSPVQASTTTANIWDASYRPFDFAFSNRLGLGTRAQLESLCAEAEKYGIKIIVDVVFNHLETNNYSGWFKSRPESIRATTSGINYSNRHSITHDRLITTCPEVNTENSEVIAYARQFIETLKEIGVKGIRFDAAKHIELPSEGSDFWKEVTSVPGMYYYGEILGTPGGQNSNELLKEYASYMSVTDESYSNTARSSAGVPSKEGNFCLNNDIPASRLVYWGESHDTYSNDPAYASPSTQRTSQYAINKAYAIVACRKDPTALYFSRPEGKSYGEIKIGQKGTLTFADPEVAEVNKFRNAMIGRDDFYSQNGSTASVTRKDGGAVIVNKSYSAGEVSVPNGGGFCPAGTYIDRISGNTFTVTQETISGMVGATGIAVIYDSADDNAVGEIIAEDSEENAVWYNLQGLRIETPSARGVYIKVYPSGKSRKVAF